MVTLAMLAAAVLTIAAALKHTREPWPADQIPLTRNEIAHLLTATTTGPGHGGEAATSPAPRPATTSAK